MKKEDIGPRYIAWMSDALITRYLEARFLPAPTIDALKEFVVSANDSQSNLLFGIFLRDESRHVGNIKIGSICHTHKRADIGFLIGDRNEWGKGLATEAISAVARFAFVDLQLSKVTAGCYASNLGSARALEKAGFKLEARLPNHWLCDGKREDGLIFARHWNGESA